MATLPTVLDRVRALENGTQGVAQRAREVGGDVDDLVAKLNELRELCQEADNTTDQVNAILEKHKDPAYEVRFFLEIF